MDRTKPGPGQESVWDYPRPPICEPSAREIKVLFAERVIAHTRNAQRVLETSHPPIYYIPRSDVLPGVLRPAQRATFCEWKGLAHYFHVVGNDAVAEFAAWTYEDPVPRFAAIRHHVAFYPALMDACYVDGERVAAQPGDFYGGWITSDIVGPFKGAPGTQGW
ncbi:MAG: DUF427 domain-containing protein [Planctomycetota bacterium]|nr:MAG: DUF427 domain-containing protein [Planctomycetota bacterium]